MALTFRVIPLLPWSTHLALLLLTLGILSAGDGAVTPIVSTLLSFASPPDAQGETLGLAQGMAGLGRVVGPLVAGSLFTFGIPLPFLLSGVLAIVGAVLTLPLLREAKHSRQTEVLPASHDSVGE